MPRDGLDVMIKRTPPPTWSDGIHYVRRAGPLDDHPMRWVVGAHRATASTLARHASTMDDALVIAIRGTENWIRAHPDDKQHFTAPLLPAASQLEGEKARRGPVAQPKPPTFSTYHFQCIRANPVAQVWQCLTLPGEKRAVGRKPAGNRAPRQAPFRHAKGECAVLLYKEPVRDADLQVRVFPSWQAAEDHALHLYHSADEEDRMPWKEDDRVVGRTRNVDIIFDPDVNGVVRPFSLWLPEWRKPVYEGYRKARYAKAGKLHEGGTFMPQTADEKAALELNRKLSAMDDRKVLTEEIAKFESIWGAEDHALNVTERVLRGEPVKV